MQQTPGYEKYEQMARNGLSLERIAQAIRVDGKDPAQFVLPPQQYAQDYSKYEQMLLSGIAQRAVLQMMLADGKVDPNQFPGFLSEEQLRSEKRGRRNF